MRKKSILMAALMMTAIVVGTTCASCNRELTQEEYLKKVLANVEKIKVAEYETT